MRLSLLTFFVWLMTVVANAQTSFSGRVVADGSKKGLGWASVKTADGNLLLLPKRKKTAPLN